MSRLAYVLALLAALAGVSPGICMCGCPCAMLMSGRERPSTQVPPADSCCCHATSAAPGMQIAAPHECCCAAQTPQAAEDFQPQARPAGDLDVVLAAEASQPSTIALTEVARAGHDPPAAPPPPLHAVLRN